MISLDRYSNTKKRHQHRHFKDFEDFEDFGAIWAKHSARIQSCCYTWLNGNRDHIEDAMSLASEKAFRYFQSNAASIDNYFSWLCKLTHNVCIDIHRGEARQQAIVNHTECLPDSFYFSDQVSESLETQVERQYTFDALMVMINQLPDEMREVIKYRFIDGMGYLEIAERLGTNQANVRKKVQLARQRLRNNCDHWAPPS